jgi:hypothetical protein
LAISNTRADTSRIPELLMQEPTDQLGIESITSQNVMKNPQDTSNLTNENSRIMSTWVLAMR